jgi:hypothetical protein
MKNNLLRKLITPLAPIVAVGAMSLAALIGCDMNTKPDPNPNPPSTDLELQLTIGYSGTARTYNALEKHDVNVSLSKDGQGYATSSFGASVSNLNGNRLYTFPYRLESGNYQLYVSWDWDNDGGTEPYEPRTQPYPISINLDGPSTKKMNIQLVDQSSPSSPGWVEGIVDFNGNAQEHFLYVDVYSYIYSNGNRVFTRIDRKAVNKLGNAIIGNPSGKIYYITDNIPAGGPYVTTSFLDMNWNGVFDTGTDIAGTGFGIGPMGDDSFVVSPGLPTAKINMTLPH